MGVGDGRRFLGWVAARGAESGLVRMGGVGRVGGGGRLPDCQRRRICSRRAKMRAKMAAIRAATRASGDLGARLQPAPEGAMGARRLARWSASRDVWVSIRG